MRANSLPFRDLTDSWWLWLLRGTLAIILAILAFTHPAATLGALTLVLGAYFLIDGVIALVHGLGHQPTGQRRWHLISWGVIGLLAGLSIVTQPLYVSVLTLSVVVSIWAVVSGAMAIITGIRLRDEIVTEWWLILGGIASIVFGPLLWRNLVAGALSIACVIGIWSLSIIGVALIVHSFRIKELQARRSLRAIG